MWAHGTHALEIIYKHILESISKMRIYLKKKQLGMHQTDMCSYFSLILTQIAKPSIHGNRLIKKANCSNWIYVYN